MDSVANLTSTWLQKCRKKAFRRRECFAFPKVHVNGSLKHYGADVFLIQDIGAQSSDLFRLSWTRPRANIFVFSNKPGKEQSHTKNDKVLVEISTDYH